MSIVLWPLPTLLLTFWLPLPGLSPPRLEPYAAEPSANGGSTRMPSSGRTSPEPCASSSPSKRNHSSSTAFPKWPSRLGSPSWNGSGRRGIGRFSTRAWMPMTWSLLLTLIGFSEIGVSCPISVNVEILVSSHHLLIIIIFANYTWKRFFFFKW